MPSFLKKSFSLTYWPFSAAPPIHCESPISEIAQRTAGVEFVQEAIGIIGPWHEFELHADPGLGGEVLREFDQRVGGIPCGPAQRDRLALRVRGRGHRSATERGGKSAACSKKRLHTMVHAHFPPFGPAIDMARRSCPLECFEQCDTVRNGLIH